MDSKLRGFIVARAAEDKNYLESKINLAKKFVVIIKS